MNDVYMDKGSAGSMGGGGHSDENMQKDHEMVFQQLSNLKANVCALMESCQHGAKQITEAWVQSKVTLANDYIDTVHSYVVNGGHDGGDGNKPNHDADRNGMFVVAVEQALSNSKQ
jgi:hypothetical protein